MDKTIKIFEMFAGYGGASFALKKAKILFECVGYSEIKKHAIKCYNQNHPNIKNFGDCKTINPKELPDFDLLTAGFPCQDCSLAGNRDLSKGRTMLINEVFRIAKAKKPKYIILENVKGLLSMNNLWDSIRYTLNNLGYGVAYKVLNTRDYGIPQNRERIWIVCKLGGWEFMEFQFPHKEKHRLKLKDVLDINVDEKYYLNDNQIKRLIEKTNITIDNIKYPSIFDIYNKRIIDFFPALTDPKHNTTRVIDKKGVRKPTIQECFRVMGFLNDEINISDITYSQACKLAGNGWDINIVSKIFTNLLKLKNG